MTDPPLRRSPVLGTDICPRCHGTGTERKQLEPKAPVVARTCTRCFGSGEIPKGAPQLSDRRAAT